MSHVQDLSWRAASCPSNMPPPSPALPAQRRRVNRTEWARALVLVWGKHAGSPFWEQLPKLVPLTWHRGARGPGAGTGAAWLPALTSAPSSLPVLRVLVPAEKKRKKGQDACERGRNKRGADETYTRAHSQYMACGLNWQRAAFFT